MSKSFDFENLSVHEGPNQSPGFLLWRVSNLWRRSIEDILKAIGLTHPQFVVLATTAWLTKNGESTSQTAIGQMANIDPNTISQIMLSLEKRKLISRKTLSDGRAKNPNLTAHGNELLSKALPAVEKGDKKFFSRLSPKDLEALIYIFQKISG